jgi:hypothetical protein
VGFVLVAEPAQCAQHRVGRRLAEAAEARVLDDAGKLLELDDALEARQRIVAALFARRPRDRGQDLEHPPRAFAAGDALAAALALDEVHEELGDVHHAGVLVHDDHAAAAHHRADFESES